MSAVADPWVGHVVDGRYRLDQRVAEGGFGTVYRALHLGFGRPVAVKLLRVEKAVAEFMGQGRARFVADLRAEGATLQQLASATIGVVHALDVGETVSPQGVWAPYLVLDWVDGEQLGVHSARRGPMPLAEVLELLDPVARALHTAHELRIVHRDVKPQNIMVVRGSVGELQTRLLDFGVAKVMSSEILTRARSATNASFLGFTPTWGAPEQFDPSIGHTGSWTDIYALALVVVGLLIGGRPYGDSLVDGAMCALDRERRPTPRALGYPVSEAVERVFEHALALDPRNRPATIGGLWESLRAASSVESQVPGPTAEPPTVAHAGYTVSQTGAAGGPTQPSAAPPVSHTLRTVGVEHAGFREPTFRESSPAQGERLDPRAIALSEAMPRTTGSGGVPETELRGASSGEGLLGAAAHTPAPSTGPARRFGAGIQMAAPTRRGASHWAVTLVLLAVGILGGVGFFAVIGRRGAERDLETSKASSNQANKKSLRGRDVLIAGGKVVMGRCTEFSDQNWYDLCPTQSAVVSTFRMGRYEVTVADYRACVDAGKCTRPKLGNSCNGDTSNYDRDGRDRHPVNCVTQPQAVAYCGWVGGRLPTSAEWELAARGTEGRSYPWGEESPSSRANYGSGNTTQVGAYPSGATPAGLFDMAGNVWEWTAGEPPIPSNKLKSNNPKSSLRCEDTPCAAAYGGSFGFDEKRVFAFRRLLWPRTEFAADIGLRCAQDS